MADNTKIEWTDATWNPITGCSIVSPGCTNCYAMKLAGTRLKHIDSRKGLTKDTKAGPVWTGEVRFNEKDLDQPLRWKRPRMIFVCAHGDLFAEGVPDDWIDKIFAVMALSPQHTFQVLTKRPERMRAYLQSMHDCYHGNLELFNDRWGIAASEVTYSPCAAGAIEDVPFPLPNVWLGVSVEDQKRAEERIPILLNTHAAVRWISAEPLLGPIDLANVDIDNDSSMDTIKPRLWRDEWELSWKGSTDDADEALEGFLDWYGVSSIPDGYMHSTLDWVVAGGESGTGARPMHPDWARSLRDQCADAEVAFHFKQWGAWAPGEWAFNLDDEVCFLPDDDSVNVTGLDDWEKADARMQFWDEKRAPEGVGSLLVGKKAAGRLLDGVTHDAFPQVRS